MAKLIMWNLMTLDGFVEGPGRDISWHNDVWGSELERLSIEQLNSSGALLFGRITYELMANYWPTATGEAAEVAAIMNRIPKFVFSRTLTRSDWNNVKFFSSDAAKTVTNLKRETDKDIYLFGSADLAASLIPHDVFDEIRIGLSPHILGSGTPLFKQRDTRQRLKLLEARPFSTGITILRYQPTA